MAKKKTKQTEYVVRRWNWQRGNSGHLARLPGEIRIKAFDDPDEADADRRRREELARKKVNPFRCGGSTLHYQTHFDAPRLHDWLLDLGLTPPSPKAKGGIDWAEWWEATAPKMTEEQWTRTWQVLDKVRFYEVVEQPRCSIVFVVVRPNWAYNDEYYEAEPEGGEPTEAYRDRERAEAEAEVSNDMARDIWSEALEETGLDADIAQHQFDPSSRLAHQAGPFEEPAWVWNSRRFEDLVETENANFYEVVEVELEE